MAGKKKPKASEPSAPSAEVKIIKQPPLEFTPEDFKQMKVLEDQAARLSTPSQSLLNKEFKTTGDDHISDVLNLQRALGRFTSESERRKGQNDLARHALQRGLSPDTPFEQRNIRTYPTVASPLTKSVEEAREIIRQRNEGLKDLDIPMGI